MMVLAALIPVAPLTVGASAANAVPATSKCESDVILIGARGTNQAPGIGGTVEAVESRFLENRWRSVWTLAVDYPALGSNEQEYTASVGAGAVNLREQIVATAAECSRSDILLAGYSQGADVIATVLEGVALPPLDQSARDRIAGVVLFGDPRYRANEPWNAPGNGPNDGLAPRAAGALASWTVDVRGHYGTRVATPIVRSYCLPGDRFCQNDQGPAGLEIHASYDELTADAAYSFLTRLLCARGR